MKRPMTEIQRDSNLSETSGIASVNLNTGIVKLCGNFLIIHLSVIFFKMMSG